MRTDAQTRSAINVLLGQLNCSQTGDLRQARSIVRPVAYELDAQLDQTVLTQELGLKPESEDGHVQHHLQTTGGEELVLHIIQLQTELQATRRAFRTYKEQAEPRQKLLDDPTQNLSHLGG